MAKQGWEKGAGAYSRSYPKLTPYRPNSADRQRDVSGDATENASENDGHSGPLNRSGRD